MRATIGSKRWRRAPALFLGLAVAACSSSSLTSPRFQPEVNNAQDSFQFQTSGVTGVSQTLTYTWQNTGTAANVDQSGSITGGSATLTIRDAQGTQVYSSSLATTGSFTTGAGQTGAWTIELVVTDVSGTLNFRVQKA